MGAVPRWGAERSRERVARHLRGPPPARYRAASRSSVAASVTRVALPSSTRSMPSSLAEIVLAGYAARLRAFRVPGPLVK